MTCYDFADYLSAQSIDWSTTDVFVQNIALARIIHDYIASERVWSSLNCVKNTLKMFNNNQYVDILPISCYKDNSTEIDCVITISLNL